MDATENLDLAAEVQTSLAHWHEMVDKKDMSTLASICHPDVVFKSPVVHKPYVSVMALGLILNTVMQVFENFTYHRQFVSADGASVVLEFAAEVKGRTLKGIDMIKFNDQGKITDFEVMVRPMSGLHALAEEMAARLPARH